MDFLWNSKQTGREARHPYSQPAGTSPSTGELRRQCDEEWVAFPVSLSHQSIVQVGHKAWVWSCSSQVGPIPLFFTIRGVNLISEFVLQFYGEMCGVCSRLPQDFLWWPGFTWPGWIALWLSGLKLLHHQTNSLRLKPYRLVAHRKRFQPFKMLTFLRDITALNAAVACCRTSVMGGARRTGKRCWEEYLVCRRETGQAFECTSPSSREQQKEVKLGAIFPKLYLTWHFFLSFLNSKKGFCAQKRAHLFNNFRQSEDIF